MTIARIFYLAAAILFLMAAIGLTLLPNAANWGLVCLALGLLLSGYNFTFRKQ